MIEAKYKDIINRQERTQSYLNDPTFLEDLCEMVSNGGSILDAVEVIDVRYSDIMRWVHGDTMRQKRYYEAMDDQSKWMIRSILREISLLAHVDLRRAYDKRTGKLLNIHDMPPEISRAMAGIEVREELEPNGDGGTAHVADTKKIKMYDKLKALELLGKTASLFIEKHEITGKVTLEELIHGSQKPVSGPTPVATALPAPQHPMADTAL